MHAEKKQQDTTVKIAKHFKEIDVDFSRIESLVKSTCLCFGRSKIPPERYEISIAIVDDTKMREINKQFLNQDLPTDCLSFNLSENDTNSAKSFELVVNAEMAVKEANLRGHSSEAELALYITHSLLHNFGFNDSTQKQAEKMHTIEDEILQQLGYGPVYNRA